MLGVYEKGPYLPHHDAIGERASPGFQTVCPLELTTVILTRSMRHWPAKNPETSSQRHCTNGIIFGI